MTPPIWIRDLEWALQQPRDHSGVRQAAELVKRMRALGVSKFHPDPLDAIAEAEARKR